ncbi:CSPG6 [Mytilus edulis]|uniref:SMC3 n=1 Tax=Mytilus edulis TaxID=6550 RepID=A0A8S3SJE2_MYTED|nr:CSPG6 [Mytilus edulis]
MIPLVLLMDKSLKSSTEESEENFELALDSLNMLLYAHRDMSSQRKRLLTPALDKKYYVLSNEGEKISSKYLFGEQEDLEKRMKEIDDSVKLGKKIGYTKGFGKDKTREPEKSNRDNNKSNGFNSGYSSGFKSSFSQVILDQQRGKKKQERQGNLGHKKH